MIYNQVAPGDTLLLTLYWKTEAPVRGGYTVFTHLQGPEGELIAQQDNPPGRGNRPTDRWAPGVLVEDPYEIEVPLDAVPGQYTLSAGMYDPATLERLSAFDGDGKPLPDGRILLGTVRVQPLVPWWRWMLSGLWLAVVVLGMLRLDHRSAAL